MTIALSGRPSNDAGFADDDEGSINSATAPAGTCASRRGSRKRLAGQLRLAGLFGANVEPVSQPEIDQPVDRAAFEIAGVALHRGVIVGEDRRVAVEAIRSPKAPAPSPPIPGE